MAKVIKPYTLVGAHVSISPAAQELQNMSYELYVNDSIVEAGRLSDLLESGGLFMAPHDLKEGDDFYLNLVAEGGAKVFGDCLLGTSLHGFEV